MPIWKVANGLNFECDFIEYLTPLYKGHELLKHTRHYVAFTMRPLELQTKIASQQLQIFCTFHMLNNTEKRTDVFTLKFLAIKTLVSHP